MISEEGDSYLSIFSISLAFWLPWQPITRAPQAGQYNAQSSFYHMEKVLTGILYSPFKWRDHRVKVGKILSILTIL